MASSSGILSIPASATQKGALMTLPTSALHGRASVPRLKVVIRRLAPGLTEDEFEAALGDEWKLRAGRVDWKLFKLGKVSKDPAKPSRPARAYLHLMHHTYLTALSEKVRHTAFDDAKHSSKDSSLLGPPSVEFAPYGRVPGGRVRKDARQGTIDQDPEFIDFLESLTNPITKPTTTASETDALGNKDEKVTVTPLIQYLRDKKANKGKEIALAAKSSKHARQDSKESKNEPSPEKKLLAKTGKEATPSPDKKGRRESRVDRAAKDAVKLLNKRAVVISDQTASNTSIAPASISPKDIASPAPLAEKKRERGNASAAARILQRDLGLGSPTGGRRGARRDTGVETSKPITEASTPQASKQVTAQPASRQERRAVQNLRTPGPEFSPVAPKVHLPLSNAPTGPASSTVVTQGSTPPPQPPTGPSALRSPAAPNTPTRVSTSAASSVGVTPIRNSVSPTATQAFLKHANASQGVTEPLLQQAFVTFGIINKVEIDKKKGFAYVDFAEPESLQKAIKASPVPVAQGHVVVSERKTGQTLQARNVRGGGMVGRGGTGFAPGARGGRGSVRGRGGIMRGGGSMRGGVPSSTTAIVPPPVPAASSPTPEP
ncbi:MAG: hypothetical protein M1830_007883 [Pleopsidium flavum]|nr:MAG: hypothetical protein M1830_007883 [Pleopsidium flavum]